MSTGFSLRRGYVLAPQHPQRLDPSIPATANGEVSWAMAIHATRRSPWGLDLSNRRFDNAMGVTP